MKTTIQFRHSQKATEESLLVFESGNGGVGFVAFLQCQHTYAGSAVASSSPAIKATLDDGISIVVQPWTWCNDVRLSIVLLGLPID